MHPFLAADGPDLSAVTAGFTSLTTAVTGTLAPALVGLAVIGIGITVGLKYLRKGASKA